MLTQGRTAEISSLLSLSILKQEEFYFLNNYSLSVALNTLACGLPSQQIFSVLPAAV
jgi:hypothetical protein